MTWKTGDVISITCKQHTAEGIVTLASGNGGSLALTFDGMLHGHVGFMPVLLGGDGVYRSIVTNAEVVIRARGAADGGRDDMESGGIGSDAPQLGACCICETTTAVQTIVMLHVKGTVSGHGWGCVLCDLPFDGASAVLCDACVGAYSNGQPLRFACRGWPASDGRVPIGQLTEPHMHNLTVDHDA